MVQCFPGLLLALAAAVRDEHDCGGVGGGGAEGTLAAIAIVAAVVD